MFLTIVFFIISIYLFGCIVNWVQIMVTFPQWEKAVLEELKKYPESYVYDFRILLMLAFFRCVTLSWVYVYYGIDDFLRNGKLY